MAKESAQAAKAFEIYLSLGPGRSLTKLVRCYPEHVPGKTISLGSAKLWCRQYGWVKKAGEMDETVQEAVTEEIVKRTVRERVDGVELCDLSLCLFLETLENHAERNKTMQLNTPQDVRSFAGAVDIMAKLRELLEGRATARTDNMTLDEVKAKLAAALTERAELLSPDQLEQEIEALSQRRTDKLKAGGETVH